MGGRAPLALLAALALGAVLAFSVDRWRAGSSSTASWQRPSRASLLESLPIAPEQVVLLGASLVQHGEWAELLAGIPVVNRGISGDRVADALRRLDPIVAARPRAVFVMVGLNDVLAGSPSDVIEREHRQLVQQLRSGSPQTRVVLMSVLPVRRDGHEGEGLNDALRTVNAGLERIAADEGCSFLNLAPLFRDADGRLLPQFTLDGVHLTGPAYQLWANVLRDCGLL